MTKREGNRLAPGDSSLTGLAQQDFFAATLGLKQQQRVRHISALVQPQPWWRQGKSSLDLTSGTPVGMGIPVVASSTTTAERREADL
jgi:hypothetical protein